MQNNMLIVGPSGMKSESTRRVFFTGSAAVKAGQPVGFDYAKNYDQNTGKALVSGWPALGNCVKTLEAGDEFAGVASRDYDANENGQWIDVYLPGSVCKVIAGVAVTAVKTSLVCSSSGKFVANSSSAPAHGAGSVIALHKCSSGQLVTAKLEEGASITVA